MNKIICFTPEEVYDMISGKVVYDEMRQTGYMSKEKYDDLNAALEDCPVVVLFEKTDLFSLYKNNWFRDKSKKLIYICATQIKTTNNLLLTK